MPKGRGSNVRRLGPRQQMARVANHLHQDHPFAVWWDAHRKRQRHQRNPDKNTRTEHPMARPRQERKETQQQAIKRQNKAAAKRVAANAARKRVWL